MNLFLGWIASVDAGMTTSKPTTSGEAAFGSSGILTLLTIIRIVFTALEVLCVLCLSLCNTEGCVLIVKHVRQDWLCFPCSAVGHQASNSQRPLESLSSCLPCECPALPCSPSPFCWFCRVYSGHVGCCLQEVCIPSAGVLALPASPEGASL